MSTKSRHIAPYDFLDSLQEEYICNEIRLKIYPRIADKIYYKKVLKKKGDKILDLAERNSLSNILSDKKLYLKYWKRIVPEFGFPQFIYNAEYNKGKAHFPYKGTIVEILEEGAPFRFAVTKEVDFDNEQVKVVERENDEKVFSFHHQDVRRLSLEETDKLFYYYPGNEFKVEIGEVVHIGVISKYDIDNDRVTIHIPGTDQDDGIEVYTQQVSRIL